MYPCTNTFELTITTEEKKWVFPERRFVEFGPEDERWARFLGFGFETTVVKTIKIPRAVIKGLTPNGSGVEFEAYPSFMNEVTWEGVVVRG